jgi:hypothetical protein
MRNLPPELIHSIMANLNILNVATLMKTSKKFRVLTKKELKNVIFHLLYDNPMNIMMFYDQNILPNKTILDLYENHVQYKIKRKIQDVNIFNSYSMQIRRSNGITVYQPSLICSSCFRFHEYPENIFECSEHGKMCGYTTCEECNIKPREEISCLEPLQM